MNHFSTFTDLILKSAISNFPLLDLSISILKCNFYLFVFMLPILLCFQLFVQFEFILFVILDLELFLWKNIS